MSSRRIVLGLVVLASSCGGSHDRATGGDASDAVVDAGEQTRAACDGVDAGSLASRTYVDLDITASGFTEHEGQEVFLETRSNLGGVLGVARAIVAGGAFTVHFPKGYRRAQDQEVIWLIDVDGDGVCNDAVGDQTGYVVMTAVDPPGDMSVAVAITDNHVRKTRSNAELCNSAARFGDMLDFDVTGVGFDAHDGQTVQVLTRTVYNGAIFGAGSATIVQGGFAFHFPSGFERFTYQEIFYFVDIDGDARCATATDHPGYTVTSAFNPTQIVPVAMPITDNHMTATARGADVCAVMNGCQLAP